MLNKFVASLAVVPFLAAGVSLPAQAIQMPDRPQSGKIRNISGSNNLIATFKGGNCTGYVILTSPGRTVYGQSSYRAAYTSRYKVGRDGKWKQVKHDTCVNRTSSKTLYVFVYRGRV